MKGLLAILIGLFVLIGCSENDKEENPPLPQLMEMFDINPNDTLGLRIFGLAEQRNNDDTVALLGNKNGRLWVQMLVKSDYKYYKITNFIVNGAFHDNIEVDLGYGGKVYSHVDYIDWNYTTPAIYILSFHDLKNFTLTKDDLDIVYGDHDNALSWVIYNNEIRSSKLIYWNVIAEGYIGNIFKREISSNGSHWYPYVCDMQGEPIYEYKDEFENYTFINLYECIKYSNNSILRQNAETGKVIWETQLEKMGQVIDGHEPKIEHSIKIVGEYAECTFNITNYDGSQETQKYNVDIETGEIIKK